MSKEIEGEEKPNKDEKNEESKDSTSRKDAIAKGMKDLEDEGSKETKEDKETKETSEEGDEGSEESSENQASAEEQETALKLFRALNDPKAGPTIVKVMADQLGLNLDGSTKKEQAQAIDLIEDAVKAELGPNFEFLSAKLTNILKKVIPAVANEQIKPLKDDIENTRRSSSEVQLSNALETSFGQYEEVPPKVQQKFYQLMDEIQPNAQKTTPKAYFDRLLKMASDETGIKLKSKSSSNDTKDNSSSNSDKINRNKRDASSRLASEDSAEVKEGKAGPIQVKSRKDAINRAIKETEDAMSK